MEDSQICRESVEIVIHSDKDFATVAYLKVKRAHLEKKDSFPYPGFTVPSPPILNDEDDCVHQAVLGTEQTSPRLATYPTAYLYESNGTWPHIRRSGPWTVISNIESRNSGASVEEEVRNCFEIIKSKTPYFLHNGSSDIVYVGHLAESSLSLSHIANINLLISSMELFPVVNTIYGSFFGASPPARACIAADLPPDIHLRLECIAYDESQLHDRHPLHVQSLSYWAPANIGPYSQAIKVDSKTEFSCQFIYVLQPGCGAYLRLWTNWTCSFK